MCNFTVSLYVKLVNRKSNKVIHLKDINKTYKGAQPLHVLKGITLDIEKGEFVSIMGASGSGKSTLLNILGILDNYDSGEYLLNGVRIWNLSERKAAEYRNHMIGFIFQSFNLISFKTAVENVELPLFYQGVSRKKRHTLALEYLERLGLLDWATHYPNELSGGQRQRVAIARALITQPQIILADELRTGLTGFAVAWGIFMLIVLLGAGNGLIHAQLQQSERFLTNSMIVWGGYTSKPYQGLKENRNIQLNRNDIAITGTSFPENIDAVGAMYETSVTVSLGEQYLNTTLAGVYPNHTQIDKVEMLKGRFINDIDQRERRKVIVISNKQARELGTLVGQHVNVGAFAFQVVGIYKEQENGRASAFTAYSTMKGIFGANTADAGRIEFNFHGLTTEQANTDFEREYRQHINAAHQAAPDDEESIWLWNRYTNNLQMQTGIGIIRTALWIVGLFTLLSGIVGVSNIMLITVKERTHEFGIRKAIGAKPWAILKLIIIESVIITTFFGYIGMVLGVAANEYMDATIGHDTIDTGLFKATMFVNPTVGLDVCIEATLVMVIAGTLAGLVPALKASRIRPIEALRAE